MIAVEKAAEQLLIAIYGESILDDPNFKDTPHRMAKAYKELLSGEDNTITRARKLLTAVEFPSQYIGIIAVPNHRTFSMCPHHMLPVIYDISIAYMPKNGNVVGASKLARVIDLLAHRAVLQEALTTDLVDALNTLNTKGVAVITTGQHMCMQARGVMTRAPYILSKFTGVFVDNEKVRNEFMFLINGVK